jgi:hypothetical protein
MDEKESIVVCVRVWREGNSGIKHREKGLREGAEKEEGRRGKTAEVMLPLTSN